MYDIYSKSLKEFIEDTSIKLPRFQRKASWNKKKRFELALSIFKHYPIGASILSREIDENNAYTRWLLDGRQRRDTMEQIYLTPDVLYTWGKQYLPIRNSEPLQNIKDNFWNKVSDFIEEEEASKPSEIQLASGMDEESENIDEEETRTAKELESKDKGGNDEEDLGTLLTLLTIASAYHIHEESGITASFDFHKYLTGKGFWSALCKDGDRNHVDCAKLRVFLRKYKNENLQTYDKVDTFIDFLDKQYDWVKEDSKQKLTTVLKGEWDDQLLKIIKCFDRIDSIFMDRKIAIIEVYGITPTDSQKIFNLINTGGTKLTASEILSAKPKWNKQVKNPGYELKAAIDKLYENLDLGNSSSVGKTVRWDIPAACTYYFDKESDSGFSLFFNLPKEDVAGRITVGFKLMSGFLLGGVKKENIDKLCEKIGWEDYEAQLGHILKFFETFKLNPYLEVFKSWGKSLSEILSDGPTMNMLFLLYRNWNELGCPSGFSTREKHIFDKNIFIELDKSFYGYLNNQWKGSSDSTIEREITNFEKGVGRNNEKLFNELPSEQWHNMLEGLSTKNSLNGKLLTKGVLAPLVYYYNCIMNIKGTGSKNPGEIDHILPQAAWSSSTSIASKDAVLNNIFNLALLPKDVNASKNNNSLSSIKNDTTIANAVSIYEEIEIKDFDKFSSVSSYEELKTLREKLYFNAFDTKRVEILKN